MGQKNVRKIEQIESGADPVKEMGVHPIIFAKQSEVSRHNTCIYT